MTVEYNIIEEAAHKLPRGFQIELHIERDSAGVEMFDESGQYVTVPTDDMTITEQIRSAIETAQDRYN